MIIETENFNKEMSTMRDATANLVWSVKQSFQALISVLSILDVMKRGNIRPKLKLSRRSTSSEPIGGPLGMARPSKKAPSAGNWSRSYQYIHAKQTMMIIP